MNQAQRLPPSFSAMKYGPPEVGYAETTSASDMPTSSVSPPITTQLPSMTTGPPWPRPYPNKLMPPARTQMIVRLIA